MPILEVSYLFVVLGAVSTIVIGMLWYGPVFGRQWKSLAGISDEDMKSMPLSAKQAMVGGLITALIMSYVLAYAVSLIKGLGILGIQSGLIVGFWAWLGVAVPLSAGSFLWEGKPFKLFILNAGYWLVALLVLGVILSL